MEFIDRDLSREIRHKVKSITFAEDASKKYGFQKSLFCDQIQRKFLEMNARRQSLHMDHLRGSRRKHFKEEFSRLKSAYEWGLENFDPKTFNEGYVCELAHRIRPETFGYRNTGGKISGSALVPPSPSHVRTEEMPLFVSELQEKLSSKEDVIDLLISSFYAHFHLVRIHPFEDGNGRTARLLQDIIIADSGLPPPVVEAGERITYYNQLEKAHVGFRHKGSLGGRPNGATLGEHDFYTFMAGKFNVSLDALTDCLFAE